VDGVQEMALVSRTAAGGGDGGVNGWYKKKGDAWKLDKGMPLSEVDGKLDECGGVMAREEGGAGPVCAFGE
jgi:hypothetical protein